VGVSAAILPDGSVVVRLPGHTVHVDVRTRAIHLRAGSSRDELSGSIVESFPLTAVDRVRLFRGAGREHELELALRSGRALSLGSAPTHELALMTARIVADVTRCKVEVAGGGEAQSLPGPSEAFSALSTIERYFVELTPVGMPEGEGEDGRGRPPVASPDDEPTGRILMRSTVPQGAILDPITERFPESRPSAAGKRGVPIVIEDDLPTDPPFAKAPLHEEDPLDFTMCRPGSNAGGGRPIDTADLIVDPEGPTQPPRGPSVPEAKVIPVSMGEEASDPTHLSKTKLRVRPESWHDVHEERDPTLEDAFDMKHSEWDEALA
jgi:hypothetical protein